MPRKKRLRKVVAPPNFRGYKPYGTNVSSNGSIDFLYEEYEAIKLTDYNLMNHLEAAKLMGISRATFARIYKSARKKIAKALVESKEIKAIFGNAIIDGNWYKCEICQARFTIPVTLKNYNCPICSSIKIRTIPNQ